MNKKAIIISHSIYLILVMMSELIGNDRKGLTLPVILLTVCATAGVGVLSEKKQALKSHLID